jgi:perosamine synthetase
MSQISKLEKIFFLFKKIFKNKNKQLHTPAFTKKEYSNLKLCIKSTYVSYVGNFVKKFEKKINKYTGSNFSVAVNSGTSALHLILNYLNVNKNSEILIPSLTYVATANAVKYCQADVNFVDVETDTLGVCPKKLENYLKKITYIKKGRTFNKNSKKEIKALIVVHLYGFPAKMLELKKFVENINLS